MPGFSITDLVCFGIILRITVPLFYNSQPTELLMHIGKVGGLRRQNAVGGTFMFSLVFNLMLPCFCILRHHSDCDVVVLVIVTLDSRRCVQLHCHSCFTNSRCKVPQKTCACVK